MLFRQLHLRYESFSCRRQTRATRCLSVTNWWPTTAAVYKVKHKNVSYASEKVHCFIVWRPSSALFRWGSLLRFPDSMDRVKWRHSYLWSRCRIHVVGHAVILCEVNRWRFVTLFKWNWAGRFNKSLVLASAISANWL